MAFNKNELIIDRVRSVSVNELDTGKLIYRLTQIEEPTLNCTAEGEEVTDAVGALITTLYRSKKATFSASNSLISLDLAAAQYGTKKQVGADDEGNKIVVPHYQIIEITKDTTEVTLEHTPVDSEAVKFIYSIENGEIGSTFTAADEASDTEFHIEGDKIIVPTYVKNSTDENVKKGKLYVEYEYETENAVYIRNDASKYPEACTVIIYVIFRDVCNENLKYSGRIVCPKAKLNPESVEMALNSTGKHAFEFQMLKDYCAGEDEDELFHIVVAQ